MKLFLSALLLSVLLFSSTSLSQIGININSLQPGDAQEYLRPLSTWFGTYFNSGAYYDADVSEVFGFKFSIIGMWTVIPDDQKTYQPNPNLPGVENVDPTATAFGNKASYYLASNGFYTYPTGLALNAVPSGIFQFAGSMFNTELMIRFFPEVKFDNAKVGLIGFGIKHEISSYFPEIPVDIAVQILFNNFNFEFDDGDPVNYTKVKSNNFAFNVHASKTFSGMFIAYGGLQYESSSLDFSYYFEDTNNYYPATGNQKHDLTLDGDNNFRLTFGGAFKFAAFVIHADVNLTKFTTYTTGLSLDF
jgi:hypothetical protein